jgi:hypothetical protein
MTPQEAKDRLITNWWENNNPSLNPEEYNIKIHKILRETDNTDYFPDSFIISTTVEKKDGSDKENIRFAVSKINGSCRPAMYLY